MSHLAAPVLLSPDLSAGSQVGGERQSVAGFLGRRRSSREFLVVAGHLALAAAFGHPVAAECGADKASGSARSGMWFTWDGFCVSDAVAVAAALESLSFEQVPGGHWASTDGHIGIVPSPAGVFVGWWDVAWTGPAPPPIPVLRDVRHLPTAFLAQPESELAAAVADARAHRAAAVRVCVRCATEYVPGEMHDEHLCHACAGRQLGIVH